MGGDAQSSFGLGRMVRNSGRPCFEIQLSSDSDVGLSGRHEFRNRDYREPLLDRRSGWTRGIGCGYVVCSADLRLAVDRRE